MSDAWEGSGQRGEAARLTTHREEDRDAGYIGQTNGRRLLPTWVQVQGPLFCAHHFTATFPANWRSALHQPSQRTAFLEAKNRLLGWRVVVGTPEGGGAVLQLTRVALLWHLKKTNESFFLPIAKAPCRFPYGQAFVPPAISLPSVLAFAPSVIQFRTAATAPILGVRLSHRYSF